MDALPSSFDEMTPNPSNGPNVVSSKARDVARLAGVSISTVSRVTNGSCNVSSETRTRVLSAVSRLKYRPNVLASELRRGVGSCPNEHCIPVPRLVDANARAFGDLAENHQEERRQKEQSRLSRNQYSQVRRVIAKLSEDLEKLRIIVQ